jgi:thiol-disulfide isomerase/thioredoxin
VNTDNLSALAVGIGVVALIVGFAVYFNNPALNKTVSAAQNNFVPSVIQQNSTTTVKVDESNNRKAPELTGISGYINTNGITLADLKGKVVLVDFWTYSCINCIRTIPYLNAWYDKYSSDGFVIIGVHSPEFDFEKDHANVQAAVEKFGIKYPVVQDNDHATWDAYQNQYWPRDYLVDSQGYIRYDHIGEGNYAETEQVIQSLLAERASLQHTSIQIDRSISNPNNTQSITFDSIQTPEIYLGYTYARQPLGNQQGFQPGQTVTYTISNESSTKANYVYVQGKWTNNPDNLELQNYTGKILLTYNAKSVNIVAGGTGKVYVSEDGTKVGATNKGTDVGPEGYVKIDGQRLYNVASHDNYGSHRLVLDVVGSGFQIYTFTFG